VDPQKTGKYLGISSDCSLFSRTGNKAVASDPGLPSIPIANCLLNDGKTLAIGFSQIPKRIRKSSGCLPTKLTEMQRPNF
jgi:hypothetical protein